MFKCFSQITVLALFTIIAFANPTVTSAQTAVVEGYYAHAGAINLWVHNGRATDDAKKTLRILENSWKHGLNPANYNVDRLNAYLQNGGDTGDFEKRMTVAVIRYSKDLLAPRINPASIGLDSGSWLRAPSDSGVLKQLIKAPSRSGMLEKIAPKSVLYRALQKELEVQVNELGKSSFKTVPYVGILRPEATHASIIRLRERLNVPAANGADPAFYDPELVKAVRAFQAKHGMRPDGVLGTRTIRALNASPETRIEQLLANLEWMRWLNPAKPAKSIVVNIPAMRLWAIENDKIVKEMSVVVGRPDRATPSFVTNVVGVRFNPNWTVPPTISREDYLPGLQQDPNYLLKKGINLQKIDPEGKVSTIAPDSVDWSKVGTSELSSYRMVQAPGADNALGQIRLLMPNRYQVYLHDTNAPGLFGREGRWLSSGCVRMEDPKFIAMFVLSQNQSFSRERMEEILATGKTREVSAAVPVPIFLLYHTIWQGDDGHMVYGEDIYNLDEKLIKTLRDSGKLPRFISR